MLASLSFPAAALSFATGVASMVFLPIVPAAALILAIIFAALLWIKFPVFRFIAVFIIGACWAMFRANLVLMHSLPPELNNEVVNITAEIVDAPEQYPQKTQILVRVKNLTHNGQTYPAPGLIRLALYRTNLSLRAGEVWQFAAKLKYPHGFSNPGLFDYEKFLLQKRIRVTGYVKHPDQSRRLDDGDEHFSINRLRQSIAESVLADVGDSPARGLVVALATGIRNRITAQQWDTMRSTGTNHLMAISGLHIGLIAGAIYWLFVKIWSFIPRFSLWLPAQKAAVAPALIAAVFYAALAGFTIPVQRALIMIFIAMLVLAMNRKTAPVQILALALTGVLLFDPLSVLSVGFWLSFAAVAIIAWVMSGQPRRGKTGQAITVQVAVSLGLIPVLLLVFGQFSLISPLANLVAVPVIGLLVTPLVLLGVVFHFIGLASGAASLWQMAAQITSWLWQWLSVMHTGLPFASLSFSPVWWTIPLAMVGVLILLSPKGIPGRRMSALWLLPLFMVRPGAPLAGEIRLTVLDVGQGLALVLQSHNNTLVYDVGRRFSDRFDSGADIVAPYLRELGADHIDQLVISHEDSDHRGGEPGLRREMPVKAAWSSVPDLVQDAKLCHAGQIWRDGAVKYQFLHPGEAHVDDDETDNNRSCVLRISGPFGAILLPGDIEKEAEQELVAEYGDQLQSDILVAPHHGSRTSSSAAFIDTVKPSLVIYSAGLNNRFHHPHPGVVNRYKARGIESFNTARSGAVSVALTKTGVKIDQHRIDHRHFWQMP